MIIINMDKNNLRMAIGQNRINKFANSNKLNMPSAPQMVRNLGNDLIKNVKSVVAGNDLKSQEDEAKRRKSICHGCNFFDKSSERCSKCGCYMAVKVYLKASNCPIGKW